MEIVLGEGIGDLLFGFTEAQAQAILGSPDKLYLCESDSRRMQFNNVMLDLSFEPQNECLLGWIEVHHPQATLFDHRLIGESNQKTLHIISEHLGKPSEYDDFGSSNTVFYEEQWLELHFEFGRLKNINFGVLYDNNDEPLWPNSTVPSTLQPPQLK